MGFVPEENNAQDVFALRLKTSSFPALPEQIVVAPYNTTAPPVEPSRLFQSAYLASSTYFIRRPQDSKETQSSTGHPPPAYDSHPDYISDPRSGLTGMPYSLIRALASLLGLPHERAHDFHKLGLIPSRVAAQQWNDRLTFATINLLLQRLHHETSRLKASRPPTSTTDISPQSQRRLDYVHKYRQGQLEILDANTAVLSKKLKHALRTHELITLQYAVNQLPENDRLDFLAGVEIALGSDDLSALQESQEDIWALYFAYAFARPQSQTPHRETVPCLDHLRDLYFSEESTEGFQENNSDEEEADIAAYINDLYSAIRLEHPESSAWAALPHNRTEYITRCVRVVRRSSLTVRLQRRVQHSANPNDKSAHHDDEDEGARLQESVVFCSVA